MSKEVYKVIPVYDRVHSDFRRLAKDKGMNYSAFLMLIIKDHIKAEIMRSN